MEIGDRGGGLFSRIDIKSIFSGHEMVGGGEGKGGDSIGISGAVEVGWEWGEGSNSI